MTSSLRKKIIRRVVLSLLTESLSDRELDEIIFLFETDDKFGREIAAAVRDVNRRLSGSEKIDYDLHFSEERNRLSPDVQRALHIVRKNGITQAQIIKTIASISPSVGPEFFGKKLSTAKLIERFLLSSDANPEILFKRLEDQGAQGPHASDDYLDLIDKRPE